MKAEQRSFAERIFFIVIAAVLLCPLIAAMEQQRLAAERAAAVEPPVWLGAAPADPSAAEGNIVCGSWEYALRDRELLVSAVENGNRVILLGTEEREARELLGLEPRLIYSPDDPEGYLGILALKVHGRTELISMYTYDPQDPARVEDMIEFCLQKDYSSLVTPG